jgi:flagellar motor component MotA
LEVHKQAGYLMLAVGMWGTLVGFFQIFDALETIKDPLSLNVISGGVKVTLLAVVYANGLFCVSHAVHMWLRFMVNKSAAPTT